MLAYFKDYSLIQKVITLFGIVNKEKLEMKYLCIIGFWA